MGRYFEEFAVGDSFVTPPRTLSESDIARFATLTGDHNPIHMDEAFASATEFGGRIAHGPMLIGMAFGLLGRLDLIDGTALALKDLSWAFEAPLMAGDTIHVHASVLETRPSRRRNDRGSIRLRIGIMTGAGDVAQAGEAHIIVMRRPADS